MYRVLLIDDEEIILQGLKKLIQWESLNIEIAGEARDGKEGLILIEKIKPDIVISDIAMPEMAGIELLQEIGKRKIRVKVVLLSGYQEFSYAQDAVRYGAEEYLLKPISSQELTNVMERLIQQLRQENSVQILKKNNSKAEILFQSIVQKQQKDDSLSLFIDTMEWNDSYPYLEGAVCVAIRPQYKNNSNTEENKYLLQFEIYEFIQQWLKKNNLGVVVRKEYNICYILLFVEEDDEKIRNYCKDIMKQVKNEYLVCLTIGIGDWCRRDGKLVYVYKTAKFALETQYFLNEKCIEYRKIAKDYKHSLKEYKEKVKYIKESIAIKYQEITMVANIMKCIELLGDIHYGNRNAVINSCILLAGEIYASLQECGLVDESMAQEEIEFLDEMRRKSTFQIMYATIEDYYNQLFLKIKLLKKRRESAEIVRIKQYIQSYYSDNITLEKIAGFIGMNASYMSVFFKKETGQNFKAYLTETRMKEAVKLLNSTEMKNIELANAVGYRDVKQFREKFREIYGLSPQEYKKRGRI